MYRKVGLTVLVLAAIVLTVGACELRNPFGPSDDDVVHGVSASPERVIMERGAVQQFRVMSREGRIEEIGFRISGAEYFDGECACTIPVRLGNFSRSGANLTYQAPFYVRPEISLPVTLQIYASYGDDILDLPTKPVAWITITS